MTDSEQRERWAKLLQNEAQFAEDCTDEKTHSNEYIADMRDIAAFLRAAPSEPAGRTLTPDEILMVTPATKRAYDIGRAAGRASRDPEVRELRELLSEAQRTMYRSLAGGVVFGDLLEKIRAALARGGERTD